MAQAKTEAKATASETGGNGQNDPPVTTDGNKQNDNIDEKIDSKKMKIEKKDNDPLSDGLHHQIKTILGDIDRDGVISKEIGGILKKYGVRLAVMSKWDKSKLREFVEKLPLKSITNDEIGLKRIAVNETFVNGVKDLHQSNSMPKFISKKSKTIFFSFLFSF